MSNKINERHLDKELLKKISESNSNIKTYNDLSQLNLTNDDMSATDFLSNIKTINIAMGEDNGVLYLTTNNTDNLQLSAIKKLNADMGKELGYAVNIFNRIVATANDGNSNYYIIYSDDNGATWQQAIEIDSNGLICYSNNDKFIVLTNTTSYYSTDGITWQQATLPVESYWHSICYGNGKFVVVGDGNIIYSTDGITWQQATISLNSSLDYWNSICYADGKFVAVGGYTEFGGFNDWGEMNETIYLVCAHSTDGITWTEVSSTGFSEPRSISYGNGKFVLSTYDSTVYYSDDLSTWEYCNFSGDYPTILSNIIYGNNKFVFICSSYDESTYYGVYYSEDGVNWAIQPFITEIVNMYDAYINYNNNKFVFLDDSDNNMYCGISEDGINWNILSQPTTYSYYGVSHVNSKTVSDEPLDVTLSLRISRTDEIDSTVSTDLVYNTAEEMMHTYSCIYRNDESEDVISKFDSSLSLSGGNISGNLTIQDNKIYHEGNKPTLKELGITVGTKDLEAGVSKLEAGKIYLVLEE